MSEYKTTLEEFTLEELKQILDDAPEGWEACFLFNSLSHYPVYYKSDGNKVYCNEFNTGWFSSPPITGRIFTKDEILRQIDVKFLEVWNTERPPFPKIIPVEGVSTVSIDVSEFVNSINISDGKVILNIDKCDIEGVTELFKGVEW